MRMLLSVEFPHEPFNSLVRSGKAGEIIGRILESIKPESAYFTEQDGKRGGTLVINVNAPSDIPAFAEPFFLNFQANCKFRIAMTPADLQMAGLNELGKKWGWGGCRTLPIVDRVDQDQEGFPGTKFITSGAPHPKKAGSIKESAFLHFDKGDESGRRATGVSEVNGPVSAI
jgi:hypothetical protein